MFNNNTITKGLKAMNATLELHTQHKTSPVDQQTAKPTTGVDDIVHRVRRVRTRTSNLGRHADGARALLAPTALIALLMALGLQFALAVCIMFGAAILITTSEDAMWIWRRHTDREDRWNID